MCGICGYTGRLNNNDVALDSVTIKAMSNVIRHRGPDGEGNVIAGNAVLGHRRLSIIDLSGGWQPMARSDKHDGALEAFGWSESEADEHVLSALTRDRYSIVFNGEIYNYVELRDQLSADGWRFYTSSDTEVLLVGYIAYGSAIVNKLRGMFSFAIYDSVLDELFIARDFFGIKPLYYAEDVDGHFVFASEAKAILEFPGVIKNVNRMALADYLCFEFPARRDTLFSGISKLPAATWIRVNGGEIVEEVTYWSPVMEPEHGRSTQSWANKINDVFSESVRYHNIADVEVGSFLSSGVDSSYMAACLSQENKSMKTFTVGFSEFNGEKDEVSWAKELSDEIKFSNYSRRITEKEYFDALPMIQWHMDEPLGDPAAAALWFVDDLASHHVKAVLSGEGADEFFGGYEIYQAPLEARKLMWIPKNVLLAAAQMLKRFGVRGYHYLERAASEPASWYYTNANGAAFSMAERNKLMASNDDFQSPIGAVSHLYAEGKMMGYDDVQQMQYVDTKCWLVDDILLKTDKMSMAHSLESRVPFLDKEVYNIARKIPTKKKLDTNQTKIPLRLAAQRVLPQAWANKKKLGFPVPIAAWIRHDERAAAIREAFNSMAAQEFFNVDVLNEFLDDHLGGKDNSRKIWIVYMFLLWHKEYFGEN